MAKIHRYITMVLFSIAALLLTSCSQDYNMRAKVPEKILAVTDWHIDTLRHGDKKKNKKYLSPNMRTEQNREHISALSKILQSDKLISKENYEVVYFTTNGIMGGQRYKLTYQLEFENYWLLVHLAVDELGSWRGITKQRFQPIHKPLQELNAFTLKDKTWKHYLVLGIMLSIAALIAYTLRQWYMTRLHLGWKIFWFLIIFTGFGKVIVDWNYSRYDTVWHTIRPTPINVVHPVQNGRWFLEFSFPIGALIFLYQRRRWKQTALHESTSNDMDTQHPTDNGHSDESSDSMTK